MSTEAITALHRASKTAVLLWLAFRRAPGAWFLLVIAFGLFVAVRVLIWAWLVAERAVLPWR